jgi:nucleoside-diphosphate-sugar epimerase
MLNIIVGKRSNLSNHLLESLDDAMVISSSQAIKALSRLDWGQIDKVNLILNQFQPATRLNDLSNPVEYIDNAISTTANILMFIKDKSPKVNKIVYTSSSSVYGNNESCVEIDAAQPLSLHATLKLANEKLISQFCTVEGIDYTIARVFNMYGGNDEFSIVSKIIKGYKNLQSISLINDGNAIRDYIHINDVVEAYKSILVSNGIDMVNIASGQGKSVRMILDYLLEQDIEISTSNIERDEISISIANNTILKTMLTPRFQFKSVEGYVLGELQL